MEKYFFAELSGTPYEIGYQHGSLAKKYVMTSLDNYKRMFLDHSGVYWEDAKRVAPKYIPCIMDYDPDLIEEMRGVADGAGVDFEDILTLNARSEVLMTMKVGEAKEIHDGCTNVSVCSTRSIDGHAYLGHNWDWRADQMASIVTFKIKQQNKPDILMVTEGGIIGKFGVNECGVGVAMNALTTPCDANGIPLHIVLRGILNSTTLTNGLMASVAYPNACPANYVMGTGDGVVFDLERMPDDYDVIMPEKGVIVHTNHMMGVKLKMKYEDTIIGLTPSSYLRYARAKGLVEDCGKIGPDDIKRILSDRVDAPTCICAHPDNDPATICTVFCMILDLTAKTMELSPGGGDQDAFYKLAL